MVTVAREVTVPSSVRVTPISPFSTLAEPTET
jgi:hypothetical protein